MNFEEAFALLKSGKKIKRKDDDFFIEYVKEDEEIWIVGGECDGEPFCGMLSEYLLSNDWEEVL
jgi:hypothetical protein